LRLLLDEMYPSVVAERLRARGHDVVAVTERPELRSLSDADVFMVGQSERRTVVTENVADFSGIADSLDERGQTHFGLVLIDPVVYRRGHSRTIGRMVTGLDRLLRDHPGGRGTALRHWL
jgi:nucleoside-diphosphate-sugar epimerase